MRKVIFREYIKVLNERINTQTSLVQVILGPRQVGKTTTTLKLIEENYRSNSSYISADSVFNPNGDWFRISTGQRLLKLSSTKPDVLNNNSPVSYLVLAHSKYKKA